MIDSRDPFFQRLSVGCHRDQQAEPVCFGNTDVPGSYNTKGPARRPKEPGIVVQAADVPNQPWYKRGLGYIRTGKRRRRN